MMVDGGRGGGVEMGDGDGGPTHAPDVGGRNPSSPSSSSPPTPTTLNTTTTTIITHLVDRPQALLDEHRLFHQSLVLLAEAVGRLGRSCRSVNGAKARGAELDHSRKHGLVATLRARLDVLCVPVLGVVDDEGAAAVLVVAVIVAAAAGPRRCCCRRRRCRRPRRRCASCDGVAATTTAGGRRLQRWGLPHLAAKHLDQLLGKGLLLVISDQCLKLGDSGVAQRGAALSLGEPLDEPLLDVTDAVDNRVALGGLGGLAAEQCLLAALKLLMMMVSVFLVCCL